jgi:hypothetical protein
MSILSLGFQWVEDTRVISCEQGFNTYYSPSPPLHGSDPAVGGGD